MGPNYISRSNRATLTWSSFSGQCSLFFRCSWSLITSHRNTEFLQEAKHDFRHKKRMHEFSSYNLQLGNTIFHIWIYDHFCLSFLKLCLCAIWCSEVFLCFSWKYLPVVSMLSYTWVLAGVIYIFWFCCASGFYDYCWYSSLSLICLLLSCGSCGSCVLFVLVSLPAVGSFPVFVIVWPVLISLIVPCVGLFLLHVLQCVFHSCLFGLSILFHPDIYLLSPSFIHSFIPSFSLFHALCLGSLTPHPPLPPLHKAEGELQSGDNSLY